MTHTYISCNPFASDPLSGLISEVSPGLHFFAKGLYYTDTANAMQKHFSPPGRLNSLAGYVKSNTFAVEKSTYKLEHDAQPMTESARIIGLAEK